MSLAVCLLLASAGGCSQPGTPVSMRQAAELDVATSRISVACGYAEELQITRSHPPSLDQVQSIANSGSGKLAAVFARDQTGIYQGESVGAIVNDSISLLDDCGLSAAASVLRAALHRH